MLKQQSACPQSQSRVQRVSSQQSLRLLGGGGKAKLLDEEGAICKIDKAAPPWSRQPAHRRRHRGGRRATRARRRCPSASNTFTCCARTPAPLQAPAAACMTRASDCVGGFTPPLRCYIASFSAILLEFFVRSFCALGGEFVLSASCCAAAASGSPASPGPSCTR